MSANNRIIDSTEYGLLESVKLDKTSFDQIYRQYWSKLYIYAFNVLKEKEICEDIIEEIFIDLWTKKDDIRISDLNSYLYQSVKYQIFNHFRRSKYKNQLLLKLDLMSTQYQIDELYEKKELKAQIKRLISRLPKQRRLIFQMSRYDGFSNKEISENLNISLQTVKNQISKSLKFIRRSLKNISLLFF
ncbi:RNA polymerase sigma-70 factor [bacterium BMS3Abin03]|nr:RNA polymerase sigma-70 factor [bacterium BMS3Abin03]